MPRGKRVGSKMPTADYDAGCRVRSTSTKCPTRKSRTSSSPPISRPENAWALRLLFRHSSKSLAKTYKSGFVALCSGGGNRSILGRHPIPDLSFAADEMSSKRIVQEHGVLAHVALSTELDILLASLTPAPDPPMA